VTERLIACCYRVHSELGPGFGEKIYRNALMVGLDAEGITYQSEKEFRVEYQNRRVGSVRVDLLVAESVILEIKALDVVQIPKLFEFQLLSYLKAAKIKVGLLVNFGSKSCQIRRLVA
jgi:GxxExxY protein